MGNGVRRTLPPLFAPKKPIIFRHQPILGFFKLGERARAVEVALRLVTVHPNPGLGGRGMSDEGKAKRMARKMARRMEKREAREVAKVKGELVVVTWNVQRMSLSARGRRKVRAVAEYARRAEWDVVL